MLVKKAQLLTPISFVIFTISSRARKYAFTITVGWISLSMKPSTAASTSPARMITEVVPSPTSSSCALASSIMDFAAGCCTSISLRIAFPSLVRTIPPIGSRSILSMLLGPRVVLTMSATALAAWMLAYWAFLPCSRLAFLFKM